MSASDRTATLGRPGSYAFAADTMAISAPSGETATSTGSGSPPRAGPPRTVPFASITLTAL